MINMRFYDIVNTILECLYYVTNIGLFIIAIVLFKRDRDWRRFDQRANLISSIEVVDNQIMFVIRNIGSSIANIKELDIEEYMVNGKEGKAIPYLKDVVLAPNNKLYFSTLNAILKDNGINIKGTLIYKSGNELNETKENINIHFCMSNSSASDYSVQHYINELTNKIDILSSNLTKMYDRTFKETFDILFYKNDELRVVSKYRIRLIDLNVGDIKYESIKDRSLDSEYCNKHLGRYVIGDKIYIEAYDCRELFNDIYNSTNSYTVNILGIDFKIVDIFSYSYTGDYDYRVPYILVDSIGLQVEKLENEVNNE